MRHRAGRDMARQTHNRIDWVVMAGLAAQKRLGEARVGLRCEQTQWPRPRFFTRAVVSCHDGRSVEEARECNSMPVQPRKEHPSC
jgi:hypothetical protein